MSNSFTQKINKSGLCLGCGFCEAIYGKDNCQMIVGEDGFFHPQIPAINRKNEEILMRICPSVNVVNERKLEKKSRIWGKIDHLYQGHALDPEVWQKSSSGGVISALAIYMLQTGRVDAVLHVGGDAVNYRQNSLRKSTSREQVIKNTSSRYAPALVFNELVAILDQADESFCFIGKPCDIAGLNNFLKQYPKYSNRFKLTISILCAGMPSINATEALISEFNPERPVRDLSYRGDGWPGFFSFTDNKKNRYSKSYNDSWGKVLNRHLAFRCKICPEGIGMLADIAVGDAWETKSGYPDFNEKDGSSLIIVRTNRGQNIVQNAVEDNAIFCSDLAYDKLHLMQPFQYKRRKYAAARILAATIVTGVTFNFRRLALLRNITDCPPLTVFKEFVGTLRRVLKIKPL